MSVNKATARSFGVGVVVLAAFGVIVYLAATASKGLPFEQTRTVKVAFSNIGTLRAGDNVKQNSVRIGRVDAVEYDDGRAVATLAVDSDVVVYRDARALIADESSLAKRFVELHPGTRESGELGDQVLPVARTMAATDLDDVLAVFDRKTRDRLQVALRALGGGAAGRSEQLHLLIRNSPELLDEARVVLNSLTSEEAELPELLAQVDQFAASFAGHEQDMRATISQLAPTLEALSTRGGEPLEQTINRLPGALADATKNLRAVNPALTETRHAVTALRPGAAALGKATPSLRGFLREAPRPLRKVPGVAELASPALVDLTGMARDARPLAAPLSRGLVNLERPLRVLAPYSRDIMVFFGRANSLVSMETISGDHMARLGIGIPGLQILSGSVVPNLTNYRVPYPAPGTVDSYRAPGLAIPTGGSSR